MAANNSDFKILLVEENPKDFPASIFLPGQETLKFSVERVKSEKEAIVLLETGKPYQMILVDIPADELQDSKKQLQELLFCSGSVPVILITEQSGLEQGLKALAWGISDYLIREELTPEVLARSIRCGLERKKAQEQLKESEKNYRTLFQASPLPMWVVDCDTQKFLSVNPAAINLYGYSGEEFLQMNIRKLWEKEVDLNEKDLALNKKALFRLKHRTRSGKVLDVEMKTTPVIFEGKKARLILIQNVTERIKMEQKLLQTQRRFQVLIQDGSDLVGILNDHFTYTYVSPSAEPILHLSPGFLEGKSLLEMIHREDRDRVSKILEKPWGKKTFRLPLYRLRNGKGQWRWLETIISDMRKDPVIGGLVANSRDITGLMEQEKRLKESLERFQIVSRATSDLILDYDIEKDMLIFNKAIHTLFGYSSEEIRNNASWWFTRVHPEDQERIKVRTDEMLRNKSRIWNCEYRLACADGSYKYVLERSCMIFNAEGDPMRLISSVQDITQRHQYLEAMEERNKRLREIAWTQSHVVRVPLARLMGLMGLLRENREGLENIPGIIDEVITSSQELDSVIRKIIRKTEKEFDRLP